MPAVSPMSSACPAERRIVHCLPLLERVAALLVMTVVAAVVAMTYLSYATRHKVRRAQADLVALSLQLDRYLQHELSFPVRKTATTEATRRLFPGWKPVQENDFVYTMDAHLTGYTLTATGVGGRLAGCTMSLDDLDNRKVSASCGVASSTDSW